MNHSDQNQDGNITQLIRKQIEKFLSAHTQTPEPSNLYNDVIQEVEKILLEEVLVYTKNVKSKACNILGINKNTLNSKISKLKINIK